MTFEPIPSYAAEVAPFLLDQYKDSTRLKAVISLSVSQLDECEQGLLELSTLYDLSTAVGAQLDLLGRVAGVLRNGLTDDQFRPVIAAWFQSRRSGTPEDIIAMIHEVGNPTFIHYLPEYPNHPAAFVMETDATGISQGLLDSMSPSGVQGFLGTDLVDATGDPITMEDGQHILVVQI